MAQVDWLYDPVLEADLFLAIASQPTGDGDCTVAVVTTAGRGYWIQLYKGLEAPATYDRAWFDGVLATVRLQPEDAVDSGT